MCNGNLSGDAIFSGETFTSRTEEGLSLSWCKLLPKTITSPAKISHRRSGLAAPGSRRIRLTVQAVTTIIPRHEASFGKYFQSFIWDSRKFIGFIQSKQLYFYRYIYVMNKVFSKDCFVDVCQLGYQLKMITKRVQDKCNCQTFNVLGIYLYQRHCFIV